MYYASIKSDFVWTSTVHPDDQPIVYADPQPVNTLYECTDVHGEYTVVRKTSLQRPFRTLTESLSPVPMPKPRLGEQALSLVYDPPKQVTVHRIEQHHKRGHEVYNVIRDGKVSTRRYLRDELQPLKSG